MKIETILVPNDFSTHAEQALEYATMIAKESGASIDILHVCQVPNIGLNDPSFGPVTNADLINNARREIVEGAQKKLEKAATQLREDGLTVATFVDEGSIHDRINATANEKQADLVVMGTHGRTGLRRALLGSVAERLVRTSRAPVITVPAKQKIERPEQILVAYDFSPSAKQAASAARKLHGMFGASVHIAHIYFDPWVEYATDGAAESQTGSVRREAVRVGLEQMLKRDVDELFSIDRSTVTTHLVAGRAVESLLNASEDVGADIVCIGATGKSSVDRILLGSVAEKLIRLSEVPVLTAHAPESDR